MRLTKTNHTAIKRRELLGGLCTGVLGLTGLGLLPPPAEATPETARQAMQKYLGDRLPQEGKITLQMPEVADNGHTVPLTVTVESAMTAHEYVSAIHVFAEKNPNPEVASFYFSPQSGKAEVSTRIRLAQTQDVVALAVLSDGSVYQARTAVKVTIGGCSA